jgi:hypothetical protein
MPKLPDPREGSRNPKTFSPDDDEAQEDQITRAAEGPLGKGRAANGKRQPGTQQAGAPELTDDDADDAADVDAEDEEDGGRA